MSKQAPRQQRPASVKTQEKAKSPANAVKSSSKPSSGFLSSLFPSTSKNLPAKTAQPAPQPQGPQAPLIDPIRLAETVVTPRKPKPKPEVTSPSQLKQNASAQTPEKKKPKENRLTLLMAIFLLCVVSAGAYYRLKPQPKVQHVVDEQALRAAEQAIRDRVNFHRNMTGVKLNRERIQVEYQNQVSAPAIPLSAKPVQAPDMMSGLPLATEQNNRPSSRDRAEAPNPDFADSRIMYTLQEQQAANDWEDKARQQYIDEFVANAARAGYKVKVDSNGVVTIQGKTAGKINLDGQRGPAQQLGRGLAQ